MGRFLPIKDDLSSLIDNKAHLLYELLVKIDIDKLGLPYHCQEYFKGSHSKRLFFSIQTSAHLLYRAIILSGRRVEDIVLMDYGAGVGTVYSLAKLLGCKTVIYNDYLEDWNSSAKLIGKAIGVEVDMYVLGDIDATLDALEKANIQCDIITSRNVIEHIYNLSYFYSQLSKRQPNAIIYSSTTANARNPLTRIQHRMIHNKWEPQFREARLETIKKLYPQWDESIANKLAKQTRGLALEDLEMALKEFDSSKTLPNPARHGTNTCDPGTGVWFEHLVSFGEYERIISGAKFKVQFSAGLWDTHNLKWWKNLLGYLLNPIILLNDKLGTFVAPFIYVVAVPGGSNKSKNLEQ